MKENIVEAPKFEIDNNILRYEHWVVQLSNVSRFGIGPIPPYKYPIWAFLGLVLPLPFLFTEQMAMFAILIMSACAIILWCIYRANLDLGKYLIIEMNGGKSIFFTCWSESFLEKVENTLIDCFNKENVQYKIDLKECKIDNMHVGEEVFMRDSYSIGDNNTGNYVQGTNNSIVGDAIKYADDWEKAAGIFWDLSNKYFEGSEEVICCKNAYERCKKKDKEGLRSLLEQKNNVFKEIFFRAASTGIGEIIKKLIESVLYY